MENETQTGITNGKKVTFNPEIFVKDIMDPVDVALVQEQHEEVRTKLKKNEKKDEKTVPPSTSIDDMINDFQRIYNGKYQRVGSMFDGIDLKDPTSTNDPMETFYEYMKEHTTLLNENESLIDVYEPGVPIDGSAGHTIYALITKNLETKYLSLSYISLLYVGATNKKTLGDEWSIVGHL
jgi:hypothetical protein